MYQLAAHITKEYPDKPLAKMILHPESCLEGPLKNPEQEGEYFDF